MPNLPDVVTWSIPAFLLLIVLEAVSFVFHADDDELGYDLRATTGLKAKAGLLVGPPGGVQ